MSDTTEKRQNKTKKRRTTLEKLHDIFCNGYGRVRFSCGGSISVDIQTAGALLALHKHLGDVNKKKLEENIKTKSGFLKMAQFAWKNVTLKG